MGRCFSRFVHWVRAWDMLLRYRVMRWVVVTRYAKPDKLRQAGRVVIGYPDQPF